MADGLLDQWGERSDRLSQDMSKYAEGDINLAQMALRTAGETAGGVGDVAGTLMDPLIPDIVKEGIGDVVRGAINSPLGKIAAKWMEDNPEKARDIMSGMNVASLLPGAAITKTGKKMLSYGDDATKGGLLANASNYINNFYGPGEATKASKKVGGMLEKGLPLSPEQAQGAAQKALGMGQWGVNAAKDMASHITSPSSRALYGEQGITKPAQNIVKGHLDNAATDSRALSKGVSQVQYSSHHIPHQAGRKGDFNPAAAEVNNRSFLTEPFPNKEGTLSQRLQQFPVRKDPNNAQRASNLGPAVAEWKKGADIVDDYLSPADAKYVEKYVRSIPGFDSGNFVIKAPSSIQTGGHFHDVMNKNKMLSSVSEVFKKMGDKDGNIDLKDLVKGLNKERAKLESKLKPLPEGKTKLQKVGMAVAKKTGLVKPESVGWRVLKEADDGVWIGGSKVGTAVTEGGIGYIVKVEKNGSLTGFMLDKHDFLEKLPGAGKAAESLLPNDMIAVTPMMKSNIHSARKTGKRAQEHFQQVPANKGTEDTMQGLLEQYVNAKPSARNVRGEQLKTAGAAASLGGLLYADNQ